MRALPALPIDQSFVRSGLQAVAGGKDEKQHVSLYYSAAKSAMQMSVQQTKWQRHRYMDALVARRGKTCSWAGQQSNLQLQAQQPSRVDATDQTRWQHSLAAAGDAARLAGQPAASCKCLCHCS